MTGTVYLVGAGPGAPDLLTLRAADVLARADIVFHDALVHPATLARATRAVLVAVGKRCGGLSTAQRFINKRLVDAAQMHATVVRLKGGDPMLFGRAQEEIAALENAGIMVKIVCGVTAASAAAAELRQSLTERGAVRSFALVTPRVGAGEPPSAWIGALCGADAGAIYMAGRDAGGIAAALIDAGHDASMPVAIVEGASLPDARVHYMTLRSLPSFVPGVDGAPTLLLMGPQFTARSARATRIRASATSAPIAVAG